GASSGARSDHDLRHVLPPLRGAPRAQEGRGHPHAVARGVRPQLGAKVQFLRRDLDPVLGSRGEWKRPLELVLDRRFEGVANVKLVAVELEAAGVDRAGKAVVASL